MRNARTVLGNHDLHLLAHHFDPGRPMRRGDTLDRRYSRARDREALVDWLLAQPLLIHERRHNDLFVHAGLVPQWSVATAVRAARAAETALRRDPRGFLATHVWQPAGPLAAQASSHATGSDSPSTC